MSSLPASLDPLEWETLKFREREYGSAFGPYLPVMPRGRPPKPPQRIKHGTEPGYHWHTRQKQKDPEHLTCERCRVFWNKRQADYRKRRRNQRKVVGQILVGGQVKARKKGHIQDIKDLERLINKYATDEQKRELFD